MLSNPDGNVEMTDLEQARAQASEEARIDLTVFDYEESHLLSSDSLDAGCGCTRAADGPVWFTVLAHPCVKIGIVVWWLGCLIAGACAMMPYFSLIGWSGLTNLPDDVPGKVAMAKLYHYFPQTALFCDVGLVQLNCNPKEASCTDPAQSLIEKVSQTLEQNTYRYGAIYTFDSQFTTVLVNGKHDQASPQRYVTPDGKAQIFTACIPWPNPLLASDIKDILSNHNTDPSNIQVGLTSRAQMVYGAIDAVERDLPVIDCVCVPLAFVVMGCLLRSARLLLLAFVNLVLTVFTTFALLYMICHKFSKVPDATQINFVTIIALGLNFDYSLFLLSRFRLTIDKEFVESVTTAKNLDYRLQVVLAVQASVLYMLETVSPVILTSSLTLAIVFSGFLFLSAGNLVMAGMGCAVTTVVCAACALTIVPALLMTFPLFFTGIRSADDLQAIVVKLAPPSAEPPIPKTPPSIRRALRQDNLKQIDRAEADALRQSWQVSMWRLISTWPYNLVVVVVLNAIAIYCGLPAFRLRLNNDIGEVAPRGGMADQTTQELARLSPRHSTSETSQVDGFAGFVGYTDEVNIIIEASEDEVTSRRLFSHWGGGGVKMVDSDDKSDEKPPPPVANHTNPKKPLTTKDALRHCGYDVTAMVTRSIMKLTKEELGFELAPAASFAPGWARGQAIRREQAMMWKYGMFAGSGKDAESRAVSYFADTMRKCVGGECFSQPNNVGPAATLVTILLPIDILSHDGDRFISKARQLLMEMEKEVDCQGRKLSFYLADSESAVINHDLMQRTFEEFCRVLPIEMLLIFVVIGIVLKSAFVPLRLALTLVLPLCSVYGLSVKVYQEGMLSWLGWPSVAPSAAASFHWEVPIFCLALTMALALDYDLFVVVRIADYRFAGYTIQGAIIRALYEHGPVVTGAGLMMAISFGGNLLAEATTLNQAGWILASGVLIDVLVVRTLLVPALLSFADKAAWWPSAPPEEGLMNEFGEVVVMTKPGDATYESVAEGETLVCGDQPITSRFGECL